MKPSDINTVLDIQMKMDINTKMLRVFTLQDKEVIEYLPCNTPQYSPLVYYTVLRYEFHRGLCIHFFQVSSEEKNFESDDDTTLMQLKNLPVNRRKTNAKKSSSAKIQHICQDVLITEWADRIGLQQRPFVESEFAEVRLFTDDNSKHIRTCVLTDYDTCAFIANQGFCDVIRCNNVSLTEIADNEQIWSHIQLKGVNEIVLALGTSQIIHYPDESFSTFQRRMFELSKESKAWEIILQDLRDTGFDLGSSKKEIILVFTWLRMASDGTGSGPTIDVSTLAIFH